MDDRMRICCSVLAVSVFVALWSCAAPSDDGGVPSSSYIGVDATILPTETDGGGTTPPATGSGGNTTTGGSTGGTGTTGGGTTTTPTKTLALDPVTTSSGVALRMRVDSSKCLARSTSSLTEGDKLIVANCSTDSRQAWAMSNGSFFANANISMKYPIPNTTVNMTVASGTAQRTALSIFREFTDVYNTGGYFYGYLSTRDQSANTGVEIIQSQSQSTAATWDITGVGSSIRGSTLSADGCATFCLAKSGSSVALTKCDATASSQRWTFVNGCLNNDAGGYLTFDTSQVPPPLVMSSSSGLCASGETWTISNSGFYLVYTNNGNTNIYYMVGDPSTNKVYLTTTVSRTHFWWYGGTKSLQ